MNKKHNTEFFDPILAQWFDVILGGGLFVTVFFLVRDIAIDASFHRILLDILTILLDLVGLYLGTYRKKYQTATMVMLFGGTLAIFFAAKQTGGITSSYMLYIYIIALVCGLIYSGRLRWWLIGIAFFPLAGIIFIDFMWPGETSDGELDPVDYAINHIVIFMMAFGGAVITERYMSRQKKTLFEKNQKIAEQNQVLKAQQEEISEFNNKLQAQLDQKTLQLSQALREVSNREAYLRSLVESQSTLLVRFDESGKVLFVNHAMETLIEEKGVEEDRYFQQILSEDEPIGLHKIIRAVFQQVGKPQKVMLKVKGPKEGDPCRYIDWEFLAIKDEFNNKTEIQAVGFDVSGRIKVEHKIQENSIKLEKLTHDLLKRNNELTDFGYMVSHNLRGPVANISGLVDLVSGEADLDQEIISRIKTASTKLDVIIKDLNRIIDIKNISQDDFKEVDFLQIAHDVLFQLEGKIKQTHSIIFLDFPQGNCYRLIKPYVFSIFYNLISNSIKYAHPERRPEIWLSSWEEDENLVLRFCDNGLGIDLQKYGDRLFNLYERFSEKAEGKGLGLHMVKVQVEAMKGSISVESKPGQGTIFTIAFPLREVQLIKEKA